MNMAFMSLVDSKLKSDTGLGRSCIFACKEILGNELEGVAKNEYKWFFMDVERDNMVVEFWETICRKMPFTS